MARARLARAGASSRAAWAGVAYSAGRSRKPRRISDARLGLGEGAAPDIVAAWVMIGAEAVRQPEVRTVYRQMVADELTLLTTLLGDCLRERGRDTRGAATLAVGLAAMIEGAYQLSSAAADVMPRGYAADAATACAELAIAAAPPN